jgi:hypothetical protein
MAEITDKKLPLTSLGLGVAFIIVVWLFLLFFVPAISVPAALHSNLVHSGIVNRLFMTAGLFVGVVIYSAAKGFSEKQFWQLLFCYGISWFGISILGEGLSEYIHKNRDMSVNIDTEAAILGTVVHSAMIVMPTIATYLFFINFVVVINPDQASAEVKNIGLMPQNSKPIPAEDTSRPKSQPDSMIAEEQTHTSDKKPTNPGRDNSEPVTASDIHERKTGQNDMIAREQEHDAGQMPNSLEQSEQPGTLADTPTQRIGGYLRDNPHDQLRKSTMPHVSKAKPGIIEEEITAPEDAVQDNDRWEVFVKYSKIADEVIASLWEKGSINYCGYDYLKELRNTIQSKTSVSENRDDIVNTVVENTDKKLKISDIENVQLLFLKLRLSNPVRADEFKNIVQFLGDNADVNKLGEEFATDEVAFPDISEVDLLTLGVKDVRVDSEGYKKDENIIRDNNSKKDTEDTYDCIPYSGYQIRRYGNSDFRIFLSNRRIGNSRLSSLFDAKNHVDNLKTKYPFEH